jgi:hypothetical protein
MPVYDDPVYLSGNQQEGMAPESIEYIPELDLALSDDELVEYINQKIQTSKAHFETELDLYTRQKKNIQYYLGKQIDIDMFDDWQVPYINNVIFRNIETLLPNALSRIPDIVTMPALENNEESKKFAEDIRKVLDKKLKSKKIRSILKRGLLHMILEFYGVIKYRWDENLGKGGDVCFENVLPENIVFDHTATTVEEMDFIAEKLKTTPRDLIMKFPKSKDKVLQMCSLSGTNEPMMMSTITVWEVHFKMFDKKTNKKIEAVCWKYRDTIIHKQKTPNWDYEGAKFGETNRDIFATESAPMYYNHFDKPQKPYIFLNFYNLGRSVVDDTNAVEQTIPIQDVINKRGRQVTELADKANGKWIVSSAFMSEEQASLISDSPDEALWGQNANNLPLTNLITRSPGQPPNPVLYQDQQLNKASADDMFATHPSSRGVKETDVATNTLALQAGDTTRIQDITQETIDKAFDEMANATLQLIKVFATEEYMTKILGSDGQTTHVKLTRDMIQDGLEVTVKSSLIDQQERRQMAQEEANLQFTDPLTYYEDMDRSNPKERARRLVLWKQGRFEEYLGEQSMDVNKAMADIVMIMSGQQPQDPPPMSQGYFQGVKQFVSSPVFQQANPQQKQQVMQYIQLLAGAQQKSQGSQPQTQQKQIPVRQAAQPVKGERQVPSPEMFTGERQAATMQ